MSCKCCDCVPCMCGKNAYPDTPEGNAYDKYVKEFNTHDPELQKQIDEGYARDM